MKRKPDATLQHVAAIPPVSGASPRPLWSVIIPTYNCAKYLEETLSSVLAQDPGRNRMEILVVDDHSTEDDPEEVTRRLCGSRATFFRQLNNVGRVRNYETGLVRSRGHLVHLLHGDDRLLPDFYAAMESAFTNFPAAGAFFCESLYIDRAGIEVGRTGREAERVGILDEWIDKIFISQRIQTPSMVLQRTVYESIGGFDRRLSGFEDWEMWIRVASAYPVGFVPRALAEYRTSARSSNARSILSGSLVSDLRCLLSIVDGYLPAETVVRNRAARDRAQAQYLLQFIPMLMNDRQFRAVARVCRDALSFSADPRTIYRMMNYTMRYRELHHA